MGNATSRFRHLTRTVGDLRFHSVEEGDAGPVVLLLAGWPQTWYAWRRVIPLVSGRCRVIALDLKGQGESSLALDSDFSIESVAGEVASFLEAASTEPVVLVGHDVGAWVAYAFSILHPEWLRSTLLLDAALIGLVPDLAFLPRPGSRTWQFNFHAMEDLPEWLTAGREREYLGWFFRTKTVVPQAIVDEDLEVYVEAYTRPGAMTAGFEYYRAVERNRAFALDHRAHRFARPLRVWGGEHATGVNFLNSLQACDPAVEGGVIPACGHYLPEEVPERVAELILELADSTVAVEP